MNLLNRIRYYVLFGLGLPFLFLLTLSLLSLSNKTGVSKDSITIYSAAILLFLIIVTFIITGLLKRRSKELEKTNTVQSPEIQKSEDKRDKLFGKILLYSLIILGTPFLVLLIMIILAFANIFGDFGYILAIPMFIGLSLVAGLFSLILWVIVLIDCVQRKMADNVKLLWILLIVLLHPIGTLAYWFTRKQIPSETNNSLSEARLEMSEYTRNVIVTVLLILVITTVFLGILGFALTLSIKSLQQQNKVKIEPIGQTPKVEDNNAYVVACFSPTDQPDLKIMVTIPGKKWPYAQYTKKQCSNRNQWGKSVNQIDLTATLTSDKMPIDYKSYNYRLSEPYDNYYLHYEKGPNLSDKDWERIEFFTKTNSK